MPGLSPHERYRIVGGHCIAVRAFRGKCIVDVRHGKDSHLLVKIDGSESSPVAATIQPLVVGSGDFRYPPESADRRKDLVRVTRVAFDALKLLSVKASRLVEDGVRDPEFPDIVQQSGSSQFAYALGANAHSLGDRHRIFSDTRRVFGGISALRVHNVGKCPADVVDRLRRRDEGASRMAYRARPPGSMVGMARPEPLILLEGTRRTDDVRVEPSPRAFREHRVSLGSPSFGDEKLQRLGEAEDSADDRDLESGEMPRRSMAVPVLIEIEYRKGDVIVEAKPSRDFGSPLASLTRRRIHCPARRACHLQELLKTGQRRRIWFSKSNRESDRVGRIRPVDEFDRLLGQKLVSTER
ncbi:hypothetical protein OP10G_1635 [Fimbriimonas ginsengisoli Gsoil 348]|uniref:Uncharacterized protein n=1 Tax=Fimbriimonas ginsengisoli Gsoil 348 TaxID=661478 RepID=A0A068NN73_FIMGI|nr:hypothetical protein OP10G_1635 [Fimbriimonas ginsengisoli Gsoil 348]